MLNMINVGRGKTNPDGSMGDNFEVFVVPSPLICSQSSEVPGAKSFHFASQLCKAATAVSVVGGIATIVLVETSSASAGAKTAVSIVAGLLILSSYCCYKLGIAYRIGKEISAVASGQAAQLVAQNDVLPDAYNDEL